MPGLVYGLVTPFGRAAPPNEQRRHDLGAFWAASGFAATMAGNIQLPTAYEGAGEDFALGSPASLPLQLGELAAGLCLMAGVGPALFHRQRTGEGQLVETSLVRCGTWVNQMLSSWYNFDAAKMTIFTGMPKVRPILLYRQTYRQTDR